nr:hypothetical protein [Legionella steelei]
MKNAYATIRGFEIMRMFKKGQFNVWMYGCMDVWMYGCMDVWMYGNRTEISFINEQFGLYC